MVVLPLLEGVLVLEAFTRFATAYTQPTPSKAPNPTP